MSYIIAYEFEKSFCEYWQLPIFLIKINLTTAVASGLSLFFFLCFLFFVTNTFCSIFKNELYEVNGIKKIFIIYHISVTIICIAAFMGNGTSLFFFSFFIGIIFLDVNIFFSRWYKDKKKHPGLENFFNRIDRSFEEDGKSSSAFDLIELFTGTKVPIFIFIVLSITTLFASFAGGYYAKSINNYYIIQKKNLVLLKIYDEVYLLRSVDLSKNIVGKDIYIWRNEDIAKEKIIKTRLMNLKMFKS